MRTNEKVAIKKIVKVGLHSNSLDFINAEVAIGKLLNEEPHSCIVRQLAVVEDFKEMTIVMEYIDGINIFEWLIKQNKFEGMSEREA